jgi:hypothetical protein
MEGNSHVEQADADGIMVLEFEWCEYFFGSNVFTISVFFPQTSAKEEADEDADMDSSVVRALFRIQFQMSTRFKCFPLSTFFSRLLLRRPQVLHRVRVRRPNMLRRVLRHSLVRGMAGLCLSAWLL